MKMKTISHHHPVGAQPVPEQLPPGKTVPFIAEFAATWS